MEGKAALIGVIFAHKGIVYKKFRNEGGLHRNCEITCNLVENIYNCNQHKQNKKVFSAAVSFLHFAVAFNFTLLLVYNLFLSFHNVLPSQ